MNNKWHVSGNIYKVGSVESQIDKLSVGIYSLEQDNLGRLYLEKLQDNFEFNYKMYGVQDNFVNRVVTTFNNTESNLGVLLNGIKGTGKSVTAKQLCNQLNLPVILINKEYLGIPDYINQIQQEAVIFIDEFEKIFNEKDGSILTVMDGVLDNGFKRVFLLTTNNLRINENLLQRPGRIRYLKTFTDLDKDTITLIVDDCLIYKEHKEETIKFISKLELITIDIVKAIVTEVNIHNESPEAFKEVFNVEEKDDNYDFFLIKGDQKVKVKTVNYLPDFEDPDDYDALNFKFNIPNLSIYKFDSVIEDNIIKMKAINWNVKEDHPDYYIAVEYVKVRSYHHSFMY